ncbi:hypothetical protein [Butyrivibrio sp. INlla21]|uniref:hypothetical protein n=1 Tax=Butyrivibrio sp. INlla21 TaxID=1520811 RepID=UPI0008E9E670|nr:hypothetical protein [Butyrivibrio sp. INlla21]SFV04569.1 hypothetical protein SAMN02910342_03215 [Butyrivibrio sp. INlla21]
MRSKKEISYEIDGIDAQIERHRKFIFILEEVHKKIKLNYDYIIKKAYEPTKNYDLSVLSKYGQDVLKQSEEYRSKCVKELEKPLRDTLKLLSEIQEAQKKVQEKMKGYEDKKKGLEAELERL